MVYQLVHITSEADWDSYHTIRRDVLWTARGLTGYDDNRPEEHLPKRYPLLLKLDGQAIGTTRLDDRGDRTGIVRLVAIRSDIQRRGHGTQLARMVDNFAIRLGLQMLFVNAAEDALGYYQKLGWEFFEWNIAERDSIAGRGRQMRKSLADPAGPTSSQL
jgi:N-acetylglutamate synthase-like GNAT family acetyltransferase